MKFEQKAKKKIEAERGPRLPYIAFMNVMSSKGNSFSSFIYPKPWKSILDLKWWWWELNWRDDSYPCMRPPPIFTHCVHSALKNFQNQIDYIVWSEGFLYKVAPPELKTSPIMRFVIHNSVVLFKILKIIVPFWLLFVYVDYYQNN